MNGKFLLVLFICLNIATLVGSAVCLQEGGVICGNQKNVILDLFVDTSSFEDDLNGESGGKGFSNSFTSNVSSITDAQSSGTSFFEGISVFLDGLKMVLGVLTLLTPIPMLAFFAGLGLPIWLFLIFAVVPVVLYLLSIVEFIRGGQL